MVSYENFSNLQAALDPAALLLVVEVVALANNNLLYHADGLILGLDIQILHFLFVFNLNNTKLVSASV